MAPAPMMTEIPRTAAVMILADFFMMFFSFLV
jgi:hypothetical protein